MVQIIWIIFRFLDLHYFQNDQFNLREIISFLMPDCFSFALKLIKKMMLGVREDTKGAKCLSRRRFIPSARPGRDTHVLESSHASPNTQRMNI